MVLERKHCVFVGLSTHELTSLSEIKFLSVLSFVSFFLSSFFVPLLLRQLKIVISHRLHHFSSLEIFVFVHLSSHLSHSLILLVVSSVELGSAYLFS